MATCADLVGADLKADQGEDSVSFLPALKGKPIDSTRSGVVHHSAFGHFAYRSGDWKLVLAKGSGGWAKPRENKVPEGSPKGQLYNLKDDPGETSSLFVSRPEIVNELLQKLQTDVKRGRSTEGENMENDVEKIVLWKSGE